MALCKKTVCSKEVGVDFGGLMHFHFLDKGQQESWKGDWSKTYHLESVELLLDLLG